MSGNGHYLLKERLSRLYVTAFLAFGGLEMVEEHRSELPFDEAHWSELTLRALRELGGDSQMVVGAKLRQKMVELAHFLLAHDREDERPRYRREFGRRSLRAVWLDRQLSVQYGSPDFRREIDDILEFEEQWRQRLRPNLNSPLLLPESAFGARANVRDTWTRARNVVTGHDNIDAVRESIHRFVREHRKGSEWIDTRRLLFGRGAPHGVHGMLAWRQQKLGFRLPNGFHFDVKHEQGRSFRLSDQDGTRDEFNTYANVDPHGFMRGGR